MSKVHALAAQAEKDGIIVRPDKCETCKEDKTLLRHHRDYSKPLEVNWVCVKCHVKEHKANKELKDPCGELNRASSKEKRRMAADRFLVAKYRSRGL
jgi:hypothetical protein